MKRVTVLTPHLFFGRSAIRIIPVALLLYAICIHPTNAAESNSTVSLKPKLLATNSSTKSTPPVKKFAKISINISKLNSTKKDKRQAQRGYTDVPIEERTFRDIANSSPNPLPDFGTDFPSLERSAGDLTPSPTTNSNLPNPTDRSPAASFHSPKLGFPSNLPIVDQVPPIAAANTFNERRDDFFDSGGGKPIPGEAGRDYPTFSSIPSTSFSCKSQQFPGYYADTEARCQVFWICQKHRMDAFLCPNGTLFNQQVFVCDWWFNVDCSAAPEYYSRNQFLYAGPHVGIDGSPTRFQAPRGNSPANVANPVGVNSNNFLNQVQSSNQIARVANVGSNNNLPNTQYQNNLRQGGTLSFANPSDQSYLAQSSQSQQKYESLPNPNQIQDTTQRQITTNQNALVNRMQNKQSTNASQFSVGNILTGGYQQQQPQKVENSFNQLRNIQNESGNRRDFTTNGQNTDYRNASSSFPVSTTQRPPGIIAQSSPRPNFIHSPSSPTPKMNVHIEPKGGNKAILTFSGTISSTARPVTITTEVPPYNHGSSTLQTPKDFGGQAQQFFSQNRQAGPPSTIPPITTTFRSSSTSYSSNIGFDLGSNNSHQTNPSNVGNKQFGSVGSIGPSQSTTTHPPTNNYVSQNPKNLVSGFLPASTTTARSFTGSSTPTPDNRYVDRFGVVQTSNKPKQIFLSTTQLPPGLPDNDGFPFRGQRSNQYTNVNGQREVMYSPSSIYANIEFPYSPSQQKNKQRLRELESLKHLKSSAKEMFSYPHYHHGQRSNAYSDLRDESRADKRNRQQEVIQGPRPTEQFVLSGNSEPYKQVPSESGLRQQGHHSNDVQNHDNGNIAHHQSQNHFQNQPQHQGQITGPQSEHRPPSPSVNPNIQIHFPPPPTNSHPQQFSVSYQNSNQPQQHFPQQLNSHHQQLHQQGNNEHFQHVSPAPLQHQAPRPTQQFGFSQPPQHVTQSFNQDFASQFSPSASPSTPFHQQIVQIPSQNIQLPFANPTPQQFQDYHQSNSRDGFTAVKSGSFVSVATTASPAFSQQILTPNPIKPSKKLSSKFHAFPSSTPVPNGLQQEQYHKQVHVSPPPRSQKSGLSTTFRPSQVSPSTPATFVKEELTFSVSSVPPGRVQPTSFSNPNIFIAPPTQATFSSTSPGHRQNAFLSHNHGKRHRQSQKHLQNQSQQHHTQMKPPQGIQYPNSVITTTIKYPEGTGSLKLGVPGASSTKRLVDFSYSAFPKSTTKSSVKSSSFPTVTERFKNAVSSSTTRRPSLSSAPQYKETVRISPGARLAGAVLNKSTSSSSAIYVDTSVTAESVSTPVSVAPYIQVTPAPPPVATSNFGLKISTMAKRRMAGAWQTYFGGGEKGGNQTSVSSN